MMDRRNRTRSAWIEPSERLMAPDDLIRHIRHGRAVHVQRQVRIVGNRPVFAPPKGRDGGKERDVPLPADVEAELMAHADRFGTADVTLPWLTPDGPLVTARLFSPAAQAGCCTAPPSTAPGGPP